MTSHIRHQHLILSALLCLTPALMYCSSPAEEDKKTPTTADMTVKTDMNPVDMTADQQDASTDDMSTTKDMGQDSTSEDMGKEDMPTTDMPTTDMSTSNTARLRLATWNIFYLDTPGTQERGPRETEDYERLKKYVARLDADVVALQEIHGEAGAQTLFPAADWDVLCEQRNSKQNVCLVIRKASQWTATRNPDVDALRAGNPNLRAGLDVTLTRPGYTPIRTLSVHMKADCYFGMSAGGCTTFFSQITALEEWIDARAATDEAFIVLGDFNRFMTDDDEAWKAIDDGEPARADLTRSIAAGNTPCWGNMFSQFIDHIMLDTITVNWLKDSKQLVFDETNFDMYYKLLSDHCPLWADLDVPAIQQ